MKLSHNYLKKYHNYKNLQTHENYTNELKPGRGARDLAILFMII